MEPGYFAKIPESAMEGGLDHLFDSDISRNCYFNNLDTVLFIVIGTSTPTPAAPKVRQPSERASIHTHVTAAPAEAQQLDTVASRLLAQSFPCSPDVEESPSQQETLKAREPHLTKSEDIITRYILF